MRLIACILAVLAAASSGAAQWLAAAVSTFDGDGVRLVLWSCPSENAWRTANKAVERARKIREELWPSGFR